MGERLAGRKAIITGAADGMGEAITRLFAAEGASVIAVDVQQDRLDLAHGGNAAIHTIVQDISAPDAAERIMAFAGERMGGLDILVNNAGIRGARGPIYETSKEEWRRVMAVNLDAVFELSSAAVPLLEKSEGGRIVNVASINGNFAAPTLGAYVTSKHGVVGLTRVLALDLGMKGINVNCILPGFIITGLTRDMETEQPEIFKRVVSKNVVGRAGQAHEIAAAALFFASPECSFITGTCLPVDGGATCWL